MRYLSHSPQELDAAPHSLVTANYLLYLSRLFGLADVLGSKCKELSFSFYIFISFSSVQTWSIQQRREFIQQFISIRFDDRVSNSKRRKPYIFATRYSLRGVSAETSITSPCSWLDWRHSRHPCFCGLKSDTAIISWPPSSTLPPLRCIWELSIYTSCINQLWKV